MAENYPTICMFLSFFVSSCLLSYFPGKAKIVLAAVCVAAAAAAASAAAIGAMVIGSLLFCVS